jgi:hypothetical protein
MVGQQQETDSTMFLTEAQFNDYDNIDSGENIDSEDNIDTILISNLLKFKVLVA